MDFGVIEWTTQLRFAIALALGFLVGLERESTKVDRTLVFGGVRTHPIISMFGFGCALLFKTGATFMLPIGLIAVASLTGIAYIAKIRNDRFGSTSEFSALLTFVTGALAMLTDVWIALALGIVNTILLSEKAMLESYVERLSKVEFLATIKFLLITVIILPVLPNQDYTPFHINPVNVWKIVIIVSTLGFVGYLLEKKFGAKRGLWISGIFGGIVSSTAVTLSVGRLARNNPNRAESALQATLLASSVMYFRVWVLIWLINPFFMTELWYRFLALAIIGAILSFNIHKEQPATEDETPELSNPFEIRPAVGFALLFMLLSVITSMVKTSVGDNGILGLASIVGIADVVPFILSLTQGSPTFTHTFIAAVMLAMLSNTVAKGIYFGFLSPATRRATVIKYSIFALLHIPFIIF